MVTTELNQLRAGRRTQLRSAVACTAALWLITGLGVLAGALDPVLALTQPPHPTIEPGPAAWGTIAANNARVLCAPLALSLLGLHHHRWGRRVGDLAVLVLLGLNGGLVGIELGRWETRLLPYLPQLPIEWLAVGTSTGSWLTSRQNRRGPTDLRAVLNATLATVALVATAAMIEVVLTPHAGRSR